MCAGQTSIVWRDWGRRAATVAVTAREGARPMAKVGTGPTPAADAPVRNWARFFGPFEVLRDSEPFAREAMNRSSSRVLLQWFLLHPETPITAAEAVDLLWRRPAGAEAAGRLHGPLHHLRRALEPERAPRSQSRYIKTDGAGVYWFHPCGEWDSDFGQAQKLLAQAEGHQAAADPGRAIAALERYMALCRNQFLPEDLYEDRFQDVRAEHEVALHRAQVQLLRLYMSQGMCHRALSHALSVQEGDPCNEAAAMTIAQVHLRNGQPAAAARQLEQFISTVTAELGTTPGPRLQGLLHRIRERGSTLSLADPGGEEDG